MCFRPLEFLPGPFGGRRLPGRLGGVRWRWQRRKTVHRVFGLPATEESSRPFRQPAWDGAALAGRSILLYGEQGMGDKLQFIRYAPLVKEHGATVIVECPARLCGLSAPAAALTSSSRRSRIAILRRPCVADEPAPPVRDNADDHTGPGALFIRR